MEFAPGTALTMCRGIGALVLICLLCFSASMGAVVSRKLKVGTSIQYNAITAANMRHAKSVGIDYIEVGLGSLKIDTTGTSYAIQNRDEVIRQLQLDKKAADDAGITIWSVHMPCGAKGGCGPAIDLSLPNEEERHKVVEIQKQIVLNLVPILHPKIVLFHPSFFIPKSEKEFRLQQMIKSAKELDKAVKSIGATMVIENMNDSHPEHTVLLQTTSDIVETFKLLPNDIYSAIDLNHIDHPEQVIRAMGKRVKTLHVSDGTGIQEKHWFPCSGKGANNWVAILSALNDTGYSGPFMFEVSTSQYSDFKDLTSCYDKLYADYVRSLPGR